MPSACLTGIHPPRRSPKHSDRVVHETALDSALLAAERDVAASCQSCELARLLLLQATNHAFHDNKFDALPDAVVACIMAMLPPSDLCRFAFTCRANVNLAAECAATIAARLALPANDLLLRHLASFAATNPTSVVLAAKLRAVECGALRSSGGDRSHKFVTIDVPHAGGSRTTTLLLQSGRVAGERVAVTNFC